MVSERYIAERIRALRKGAGMDVETVGAGVGRSGKTISAWETGRNVPSAEMLVDVCRFFGVSIDYFYPPEVTRRERLSEDERRLLELYNGMDATGKDALLDNAAFLCERHPLNTGAAVRSA